MRVALAADHAGYQLKDELAAAARELGHEVLDLGTDGPAPVDYPDCAEKLGAVLTAGRADRGVLICGSGVGASVACNKLPGLRAGLCHDTYSAHQSVEHDDANVLVLGARVVGRALARELMTAFLHARFSGERRHVRRLAKIRALEQRFAGARDKEHQP
ncbi:MAG TPA: RpiB/LacA/LacB family sugar-phosphate isomerase [Polyangia bacterium]|jgi:ribose 5-phosphate isomerase B